MAFYFDRTAENGVESVGDSNPDPKKHSRSLCRSGRDNKTYVLRFNRY